MATRMLFRKNAVSYSTKVIKSKQITTGGCRYFFAKGLYPIVQK